MSREFEIIKKKNLPDEAKIIGFSFLKEPTKEDKEKQKYDFCAFSNGNELGCMLSKRNSYAFHKGYVKVDSNMGEYVEVKTRGPLILLLLLGLGLGAALCFNTFTPNQTPTDKPSIEQPVGNFDVSDKQHEKEEAPPVPMDDRTITFAGYGSYKVSALSPMVELKNPANNFVTMVFSLTDKASGELIARTGAVKPGEFVYVNVMDFYTEVGTYDVLVNISTVDPESGAAMNGMDQEMQIVVS